MIRIRLNFTEPAAPSIEDAQTAVGDAGTVKGLDYDRKGWVAIVSPTEPKPAASAKRKAEIAPE